MRTIISRGSVVCMVVSEIQMLIPYRETPVDNATQRWGSNTSCVIVWPLTRHYDLSLWIVLLKPGMTRTTVRSIIKGRPRTDLTRGRVTCRSAIRLANWLKTNVWVTQRRWNRKVLLRNTKTKEDVEDVWKLKRRSHVCHHMSPQAGFKGGWWR